MSPRERVKEKTGERLKKVGRLFGVWAAALPGVTRGHIQGPTCDLRRGRRTTLGEEMALIAGYRYLRGTVVR
jgi:hypothetical protein